MQRRTNILFNILLCLNCLLLFFALAGHRLHVPAWLQVAGRMHPLVLHFPIVLVLLYIGWIIFLQPKTAAASAGPEDETGKWLLFGAACTSAVTAIMGMLLSKEEGYNADALLWHKWGGIAVSLFSFGWFVYKNAVHRRKYMPQAAAAVSFILIVFTGHQGSNITHGENYLFAPVLPEKTKPVVPIEQAVVYTDMVKPILDEKCMSCHSSKKAKGELVMETEALLLKGGKHGALWTARQPDISLLLQRIHLPPAEKKHMPPAGKPQLDEDEIAILFQWVKSGASFKQKVNDLTATDSLRLLANKLFGGAKEESYDFAAAEEKTVEKLNNNNRLIQPLAIGLPALSANFYNRQNYTTASLKDLLQLKTQLVSLDLAYMPLKEEDVAVIAQLTALRKLNLNFSTVPGNALATLNKLPLLNHLSLSGTALSQKDLEPLAKFPALHSVYLWNTPLDAAAVAALRKMNTHVVFEMGQTNENVVLKLNPPIMETDKRIVNGAPLEVRLKHFIKGTTIRYTTDGTSPDSVHSLVYNNDLRIDKAIIFTAKAFKPGWTGSDSITATFYKNSFQADSIRSLTPLDSLYKGIGPQTLINAEKGPINFSGSKQWLGFRRNKMEMLLHYSKPVRASSVTLSGLVNTGGYVFPPASIEVWGGTNEKALKLLAHIKPAQPDSSGPSYLRGYDCNFQPVNVQFIKVVAVPVNRLPAWHPGKTQQGWLFTDEILVN